MGKHFQVLMFLAFILVIFTGTARAADIKPACSVKLIGGGQSAVNFETTARTVGEFLAELGVKVSDIDKVTPDSASRIKEGLLVTYDHYFPITIIADGQEYNVAINKGSVSDVIADFSDASGIEYVCVTEGLGDFKVVENTVLEISSRITKSYTTTEAIPFENTKVENPNVEEGITTKLTEGVAGVKEIVTNVTYLKGKEISRVIAKTTVTKAPVNEVIEIGTKIKVVVPPPTPKPTPKPSTSTGSNSSGAPSTYRYKLTMSATAYCSCVECTGKRPGDYWYGMTATGMKARYGVVAVDPKVIPLYTHLYIEGYGYAIAGDTGGAIKGKKIDLYFDSMKTVNKFGRQTRTVYVLD